MDKENIAIKHSNHIQDHHWMHAIDEETLRASPYHYLENCKAAASHCKNPKVLDKLVNHYSQSVRENVAMNPHATKDHYDRLMTDKSLYVKKLVSEHTPHEEHIDHFVRKVHNSMESYISYNPHLKPHHIDTIIKNGSAFDLRALSTHKKCTTKHLHSIFEKNKNNDIPNQSFTHSETNIQLAKHPNADKDLHSKLLQNNDNTSLTMAVAHKSNHEEHHLQLMHHDNSYVREIIAKKSNSTKVLQHLANDRMHEVSDIARGKLKLKEMK